MGLFCLSYFSDSDNCSSTSSLLFSVSASEEREEDWADAQSVGFLPLVPLVTIKSVETVIKVLQHILMPRLGPHPSARARLITSHNTRRKKTLRKENFVHCNKTMWSVMRLGSEIGQFVSMFIGYIQLCL